MESKIIQNAESILIEFVKTVKAIHLYPEGHANLDLILSKSFSEIKSRIIAFENHITWKIDTKGFYEGSQPIGGNYKGIDLVAKELFTRRINEITLTLDLTLPELKNFLRIIKMKPDEIMRLGSIEKVLHDAGIKGLWVNEIPYESLSDRLTEHGDKKEDPPSLKKEDSDKISDIHRAKDSEAPAEEELSENVPEEEKEKGIQELLFELEEEYRTDEYEYLLNKILSLAKILLSEKTGEEDVYSAIITLASHAFFKTDRTREQRTAAQTGMMELISPETIRYLITRFCKKDEEKKNIIQRIFLNTSKDCVKELINTLIEAGDIHTRKNIFNCLVMLGDDARIEAESLLHDDRWFIVRQMASLIGHIGNPKSLERLKPLIEHNDVRVRKEALTSIARLPIKESTDILISLLKTKEKDILLHIILLLGALKDRSSLPVLMELSLQKGILYDNTDIRKEAVKAVIGIGDKGALTCLMDILKSKTFIRKDKHDEIKMLALEGILKIGGKEAVPIIESMLRNEKNNLKERFEQLIKEIYG